jgi:hypothetical protein
MTGSNFSAELMIQPVFRLLQGSGELPPTDKSARLDKQRDMQE